MLTLTPLRRAAPLIGFWLAAALPLLVYAALFRSSVGVILGVVGQLGLACLLALLPLPRKILRWVLAAALTVLVAGGVAEREFSKHSWQGSDKAGLWSALGLGDTGLGDAGSDTMSGYSFRNWNAAGLETATLRFDVRLVSGQTAWDWFRSDAAFVLEQQPGLEYPHTRVQVPKAVPGDGQPYLMRTFDVGEPLSGRIFRVLLDLRRAPKVEAETALTTVPTEAASSSIVSGNPIGGRDCRGIALQAWTERGGGRCLPVALTDTWQRYSLSWRVPEGVDASVVRIVLSGFAEQTFDVRRVRLFTSKKELRPLLPQGGGVQVAWGRRPEAHSGKSFIPTAKWRTFTVAAARTTGDTLSATLYTASGLVLETRNVTVTGPDGAPLPRAPGSTRQTIVFGDPNLAGHTLGTLGLALVSLAGPLVGAFGGALTLLGVSLTGSRAALLGVGFSLLWLFWLQLPTGRRRLAFTALGVGVVGLAGALGLDLWPQLSALRLFSLGETTARRNIWTAAWEAFAAHPWRGLGGGGFPAYWAELHRGEAVQHAHNLWLEFAAGYGALGLLSTFSLTLSLSLVAWRWGGARALALVGGVLVMNLFDTTFFYSGVIFTLTLTLGAFLRLPLRPDPSPLHTTSRRGAHNIGVSTGANAGVEAGANIGVGVTGVHTEAASRQGPPR